MPFTNEAGIKVVGAIIDGIQKNKDYLSAIDGEIGDGDHGVNMNKGFTIAEELIKQQKTDMAGAFSILGKTLMTRIGGSLGPLYGSFFNEMGKASFGEAEINQVVVGRMLRNAAAGIDRISSAKQGDKTLIDTLQPAVEAFNSSESAGDDLKHALGKMKSAAYAGMESTKDMVAKIGRSSRLGERSRGVLDAGAASMNIILQSFADQIIKTSEEI